MSPVFLQIFYPFFFFFFEKVTFFFYILFQYAENELVLTNIYLC